MYKWGLPQLAHLKQTFWIQMQIFPPTKLHLKLFCGNGNIDSHQQNRKNILFVIGWHLMSLIAYMFWDDNINNNPALYHGVKLLVYGHIYEPVHHLIIQHSRDLVVGRLTTQRFLLTAWDPFIHHPGGSSAPVYVITWLYWWISILGFGTEVISIQALLSPNKSHQIGCWLYGANH